MDNSKTHTGQRTRELIENAGAILLFTSPFSPDLNPIEYCFHIYKEELKSSIHVVNICSVQRAHLNACQAVTPAHARHTYRHLGGAIRNVPDAVDVNNEDEEAFFSAAALLICDENM